eukprot:CAMPEP_0171077130 /NCGR_PEP_ID=MMETSP0766_2-20121228/13842_1 /TAXON_ID=439317 /ORGANISM="Gambierdiscus australes, Strain CAWD 149" /LENGTH=120 /DNA_ID=CAMNT_0011534165 /DNA_START=177 /DNA_END=540 /DNA_ORIENTATION=+
MTSNWALQLGQVRKLDELFGGFWASRCARTRLFAAFLGFPATSQACTSEVAMSNAAKGQRQASTPWRGGSIAARTGEQDAGRPWALSGAGRALGVTDEGLEGQDEGEQALGGEAGTEVAA